MSMKPEVSPERIKILKRILKGMSSFFWINNSDMIKDYERIFKNDEMGQPLFVKLDNDLIARGFNGDEFFILYQPIVSLKEMTVCGMEVVIRWKHPKYGVIEPIEFIPLAEENNLMAFLSQWVLQQACMTESLWKKEGLIPTSFKTSINLSAANIEDDDFLLKIAKILSDNEMNSDSISFDFGQGFIQHTNIQAISTLNKKGFDFALDDFGTSGSLEIDWIKGKGFRTIKIDRPLIGQMMVNPQTKQYIINVLSTAGKLGVNTLAEGVETKEQLNFLKENGCDFMQGYYFSQPIPANEFTLLLKVCRTFRDLSSNKKTPPFTPGTN